MSGWMLAALLGGLVLLGLAVYAGTLLARLKRQHDMQRQAIAATEHQTAGFSSSESCRT